jgi:hypothetical protein
MPMTFERENAKPVVNVSEAQLLRGLAQLKGVSACRFASLSREDGSYVQAGGGGMTCALEWRDATDRQFRTFQDPPVVPWPGVTALPISGGSVRLRQAEFFHIGQVRDAFLAFFRREPFPEYIRWRDITDEITPTSTNT